MDKIVLRSAVSKVELKRALYIGTFRAVIGGLTLLAVGGILPEPALENFGILAFIFGIGMITWGLIPYKRMKQLEEEPYSVTATPHDLYIDLKKGEPIKIPHAAISALSFEEGKGITIELREPQKELFLPHFSKRSFEELEEILFAI